MRDLDPYTVLYRLWRLKRLITVAVLLPFPGIFLASLIGLGLGFGKGGGALWILWILVVLVLAVRFPNGWVDHFALGLPLGAIAFLSPFAVILGIGPIGGVLFGLAILVAGFFWINLYLPLILDDKQLRSIQNTFETRTRIPAERLRDAVFLRPNATCGLHECGPANADGVFKIKALGYNLGDLMGDDAEPIEFYGRIMEDGEFTQTTQYFIGVPNAKDVTTSTILEEIVPMGQGCRYLKEEIHDHFSAFAAIGFWLNDVEADHFTATVDAIRQAPPRAIKLATQETFLNWITAKIISRLDRNGEGEP